MSDEFLSSAFGSFVGVAGALLAVRLSHALESSGERKRLLFGIWRELVHTRQLLEQWERQVSGAPSWKHNGPPTGPALRVTDRHELEIAELPIELGQLLVTVNRKLSIVHTRAQDWRGDALLPGSAEEPLHLDTFRQMQTLVAHAIASLRLAADTVHLELRKAQRPWWRAALRLKPAPVLPTGYDDE